MYQGDSKGIGCTQAIRHHPEMTEIEHSWQNQKLIVFFNFSSIILGG
jgi:hypothetical protein